jgi:hypothetical protein
MSTMVGLAGLGLAGVGLAHSAKPDAFESITAQAFPERTPSSISTWTKARQNYA